VGPLRDVGIYALHAMLDLFGPPVGVTAQTATLRGWAPPGHDGQETAPDAVTVSLRFPGGRLATLETGFFVHASLTPWAEIYGETGTIALDMRAAGAPIRVCRVESALDHSSAAPDWNAVSAEEIVEALRCGTAGADGWFDYMAGLEEFLEVVRTGRTSPLSADRACQVLDVIDRAYLAAERAQFAPAAAEHREDEPVSSEESATRG
jgi:predicted dehydrogenase